MTPEQSEQIARARFRLLEWERDMLADYPIAAIRAAIENRAEEQANGETQAQTFTRKRSGNYPR